MLKRFFLIFFSSLCLHSFAQETFPVNGVATEFEPIFAFINAHIVSPDKEIVNGILLIQGNKILEADTVVQIPTGAIEKDLKGDYIYASFIDLNTQYGLPKTDERKELFIGTKPFTQKLLLQTTLVIIKKQKISEALDLAQYSHIIKMG